MSALKTLCGNISKFSINLLKLDEDVFYLCKLSLQFNDNVQNCSVFHNLQMKQKR